MHNAVPSKQMECNSGDPPALVGGRQESLRIASRASLRMSSPAALSSDPTVTFNVGGKLFTTRRSTVMARHSLLAVMLREDNDKGEPQGPTDGSGHYFFDRSPVYFEMLLNFLRTGKIIVPETRAEQLSLLIEAEYFGMDAVANALRLSLGFDEGFALSDSHMYEYPLGSETTASPEGPLKGIVVDGLIACLDANDSRTLTHGGHRWHDASGHGNDAHFPPTAPLFIPSHTCAAFRFASDMHRTLAPVDVNPSCLPACSIEVWVKLRAITAGLGFLVGSGTGGHCRALHLHDRTHKTADESPQIALVSGERRAQAGTPALGRWMHIVGVWAADGSARVFRDGRLSGSVPPSPAQADDECDDVSRLLAIGAHHLIGNSHIDGSVGVLRVYDRALADYEVVDNYYAHARRFSHGLS